MNIIKFIAASRKIFQKEKVTPETALTVMSHMSETDVGKFLQYLPSFVEFCNGSDSLGAVLSTAVERKKGQDKIAVEGALTDYIKANWYLVRACDNSIWANHSTEKFKSGIYDSENFTKKIVASACKFLAADSITNKGIRYDYYVNGDFTFDHFDTTKDVVELDNVGFRSEYLGELKGQKTFKELYSFNLKGEAYYFYMKSPTLLMLAAYYGLDDAVEVLIKKGCDVHRRDEINKKTALDYYRPIAGNATKTAYIKSLLDGSYDNGYYVALYERQKLDSTTDNKTKVKKVNKL